MKTNQGKKPRKNSGAAIGKVRLCGSNGLKPHLFTIEFGFYLQSGNWVVSPYTINNGVELKTPIPYRAPTAAVILLSFSVRSTALVNNDEVGTFEYIKGIRQLCLTLN